MASAAGPKRGPTPLEVEVEVEKDAAAVEAAVVVVAAVAGQPTPPSVKDGGALPEHTEYDCLRICPFLVVESGSSPPHADTEE